MLLPVRNTRSAPLHPFPGMVGQSRPTSGELCTYLVGNISPISTELLTDRTGQSRPMSVEICVGSRAESYFICAFLYLLGKVEKACQYIYMYYGRGRGQRITLQDR